MNTAIKIKEAIAAAGGLDHFPVHQKKPRPIGCPRKSNMKEELQSLTSEEIHLAFNIGLIGNRNRKGSIVEDAHF